MIVPNEKAKPADYEREKLAWKEYLGVESAQFSKMGDTFKNEGVAAFDPYNYNTQTLELLPTTPPFFYMSETEFKSIGGSLKKDRHNYYLTVSARNVHSLQKNLGMKTPIEHMYVVADADADRVKKVCPNAYSFIEDFCIKTLLAPKVQKKIGNIKPMMSNASSTFSSIRGLVKRDPQWADTLKDSKIGEWFDHMRSVKGSMSYDYTTMQVLKNLKTALGEDVFPSIVPEFYDGNDVESTISTRYPFLQTHTYSRFALSVAQLQHLKAYVQWCEDNGASPPGQAKVSAIDDNAPAGP